MEAWILYKPFGRKSALGFRDSTDFAGTRGIGKGTFPGGVRFISGCAQGR